MSGIAFVVGACLLWAIDTLIRYPLLGSGVSTEKIVFFEHLILVLLFLPFLISRRKKIADVEVSHLFFFFMVGGMGSALGTLAFTKAFTYINPTLVILLQKLQPLVAITLAAILLKERIGKQFVLWGGVCLLGSVLMLSEDSFTFIRHLEWSPDLFSDEKFLGYLFTFIAVFCWGGATVFGKLLSREGYQGREIMAGRFIFGFLTLLPLLYYFPVVTEQMEKITMGKILILALLSGIAGMFLYYQGLKRLSSRLCSLTETFFPFAALIINWIFLDATLGMTQLLGGAILVLGSTMIQVRQY